MNEEKIDGRMDREMEVGRKDRWIDSCRTSGE